MLAFPFVAAFVCSIRSEIFRRARALISPFAYLSSSARSISR